MSRHAWRQMAATSREIALTAGAIVGTICLLFVIGGAAFGVQPLIVRSGSMEPTIATGALAISRTVPAGDLVAGDIVSVHTLTGTRVTHRIVEVRHQGTRAVLTLKGDANNTIDQQVYSVASAERVSMDVPYLGYVVSWTSGKAGVFLGGLAAGGLILLAFKSPGRSEPHAPRYRSKQARGGPVLGVTVVVLAAGLGGHADLDSQMTWAFLTDTAAVSGSPSTTLKVPAVVFTGCVMGGSNSSRTATFNWAGSPLPTTYAGSVTGISTTGTTLGGTTSNRTFVVSFSTTSNSGNRGKTGTVTVTPKAGATWTGTPDSGTVSVSSGGTGSCSV